MESTNNIINNIVRTSTKNNILDELKENILVLDGAMGTLVQEKYRSSVDINYLNVIDHNFIKSIHKQYWKAGSDIVLTGTFGANRLKLKDYGLQDKTALINQKAVENARQAACCYVAGDIGPLGQYIKPLGELDFDEAVSIFREQADNLKEADLILVETIADIKVLKAAIIGVKESKATTEKNLPLFVSMTFEGKTTPTGTRIRGFVDVAESLGVDIIGVNCSGGPVELFSVGKKMRELTDLPIALQPNAGLPKLVNGKTVFNFPPEDFRLFAEKCAKIGINLIGGCCGTTPEHIRAIAEAVKEVGNEIGSKLESTSHEPQATSHEPQATNHKPLLNNQRYRFSSRTKTIEYGRLGNKTIIVGERINPTGKKDFKEELKQGRTNYAVNEALAQVSEGAQLLDINVGIAGLDEETNMANVIRAVQDVVDAPIIIDTSDVNVLEKSLKEIAGKPLINSVNGSEKSLKGVLPLAKKYGAAIIVLCLDENGIPETTEGRVKIAKRIINRAESIGIRKNNIIIDPLTMTIATDPGNEKITLETMKKINDMGYLTILGISNISHGLPERDLINSKFLRKASEQGLGMAIINPKTYKTAFGKESNKFDHYQSKTGGMLASLGSNLRPFFSTKDYCCKPPMRYIGGKKDFNDADEINIAEIVRPKIMKRDYSKMDIKDKLYHAILYGDSSNITMFVEEALCSGNFKPLEINDILSKAMNKVGELFELKNYYLPQVIASAKAMKTAFCMIKEDIKKRAAEDNINGNISRKDKRIMFATVQEDVHDIGKNLNIALLEANGYDVIDLGKSVPSNIILQKVIEDRPDVLCLSALMTTTAPYIKDVIDMLRDNSINIPVMAGGAVVTEEYAVKIDAEYAKNAVETVDVIREILGYQNESIADIIYCGKNASSTDEKKNRLIIGVEVVPFPDGEPFRKMVYYLKQLKELDIDFISVTKSAGGSMRAGTLPIAYYAQEILKKPILAHFTCREFFPEEVETSLLDLWYMGIRNILALRGDPPGGVEDNKSKGIYKYAYQLVEHIKLLNDGKYLPKKFNSNRIIEDIKKNPENIFSVKKDEINFSDGVKTNFSACVAAHPECSDWDEEMRFLKKKQDAGAEWAITQMMFDADEYERYVKKAREYGIIMPIVVGVRPITSSKQIAFTEKVFKVKVPDELKKILGAVEASDKINEKIKFNEKESYNAGVDYIIKFINKLKEKNCHGVQLFVLNDIKMLSDVMAGLKIDC
ncbi:MAG: homocysteine S-methyltransferase family protein [Candidatus Woesearchaeota archaeon]